MSDFQAIVEFFEDKNLNDCTQEDGMSFHSAKDYATYLSMQTHIILNKVNGLTLEEEKWIHYTM